MPSSAFEIVFFFVVFVVIYVINPVFSDTKHLLITPIVFHL